jgi:hypothetical protein
MSTIYMFLVFDRLGIINTRFQSFDGELRGSRTREILKREQMFLGYFVATHQQTRTPITHFLYKVT